MPYLSEVIGRPVRDAAGQVVGRLADLIVPAEVDFPPVTALAIKRPEGGAVAVPWEAAELEPAGDVRLRVPATELPAYQPTERDLSLARQVLDRQIIDLHGTRVVRVNDLQLTRTNGQFRLVSVDVGAPGVLRRLGLERPVRALANLLGLHLRDQVIAWHDVNPVESGPSGLKLRVTAEDLARLHPADIAEIVSQLDQQRGEEMIQALDAETAAETLQQFEPDVQTAVIEGLDDERAADILEEMGPDDAADVLGDLSHDRAAAILRRMDPEDARDVRELLGYPEESAGGIMTTEYVTVPPNVTAGAAIELVRQQAAELDNVYYIYVVDEDERLLGVLSLKDLIVSPPEARIADRMHRDLISVDVATPQEEVARKIAKYNLLALPVVDEENRLQGIVTVDDAMDIILPVAWKKRLPRIFR